MIKALLGGQKRWDESAWCHIQFIVWILKNNIEFFLFQYWLTSHGSEKGGLIPSIYLYYNTFWFLWSWLQRLWLVAEFLRYLLYYVRIALQREMHKGKVEEALSLPSLFITFTTVKVQIFVVTIFCGLNFREDQFSWVRAVLCN